MYYMLGAVPRPSASLTLYCTHLRIHRIRAHARPHNAVHSPSWGERSEPHSCGENGFIYVIICLYGTCVFRIYTSCLICARCNISTLQVSSCNHCCSRDKTSRTERLNSGDQRHRDLKKARKGGTTSKTEADY